MTLILGHRGHTKESLENTAEALDGILKIGADGAEVDVQVSADGIPFLFHDETLERLAGRPEKAADLKWKELQSIPLHSRGKAYKILSLSDLCEQVKGKIFLNIEIKPPFFPSKRFLEPIALILEKQDPALFLLSSFHPFILRRCQCRLPRFKTGLLFHEKMIRPLREIWYRRLLRTNAVNPAISLATTERLEQFISEGYEIFVWTVNQEDDIKRGLDLKLTGLITDECETALRLKQGRSP